MQPAYFRQLIKLLFRKGKISTSDNTTHKQTAIRKNPYLSQIREIMEQILAYKDISYGEFFPIIIDGSDSGKTVEAARALGKDLNHLVILTEVPAYFMELAEIMYEEHGLIVEIIPKINTIAQLNVGQNFQGNVILDFEQPKENDNMYMSGEIIYIPLFKKEWKAEEEAGNLDIAVPIGYNTVIVSIGETQQKCPCMDRFERAFWLEQ